jgi:hypothetical protein
MNNRGGYNALGGAVWIAFSAVHAKTPLLSANDNSYTGF